MAVGGVSGAGGEFNLNPRTGLPYSAGPSSPLSSFGNPASFTAAAKTQASDYDTIMQNYANIISGFSANPLTAGSVSPTTVQAPTPVNSSSIAPQTAQYSQSPDVTRSLSDLSGLADTGGYTDAGIADIRARDIAPTRSIYANAQQNIERQRALDGGYSPNFNATQAKLARDESEQIGDITTAANAGIAQNVAANRIAAASPYASASASANAAKTAADQHNADIVNQINALNEQNRVQTGEFNTATSTGVAESNANRALSAGEFNVGANLDAQRINRTIPLQATAGMTSLYGTTPALTNTFGNQVAQATSLGQNQQQINTNNQRNLYGFMGGFG